MSIKTGFGRLIAATMVLVLGVAVAVDTQPGIDGTWQGILGGGLRLTLHLLKAADGGLSADLVSVDQGGAKIPVQSLSLKDQTLSLNVDAVKGQYVGKLNATATELTGTWTQNGQSLPLNFKRNDPEPPAARRPQDPHKPYPYREEEVSYPNTRAGIKLAGTLTLPKGAGPFPAALLITGSGKQNRDEELVGHKPFLVLSDYLTRRGIAVLRVDDRGMGGSTGDFDKATSADFATDVLAGVSFLKARSDIRPDRIGLIGHSEGGLIAPMVAVQSPDVAFIVLMAGTSVSGETILAAQQSMILQANGTPEAEVHANEAALKKAFVILREESDPAKARVRLVQSARGSAAILSNDKRADFEKSLEQEVDTLNGPWMRYFLKYDPALTLRKVTCPVLALFGELDLQVPAKLNRAPMEAALQAGGNHDYTVRVLPGLNHLFQQAKTGSPSEYGAIEETINPAALKIMGDWVDAHVQAK